MNYHSHHQISCKKSASSCLFSKAYSTTNVKGDLQSESCISKKVDFIWSSYKLVFQKSQEFFGHVGKRILKKAKVLNNWQLENEIWFGHK